jgi:hypothetical protein
MRFNYCSSVPGCSQGAVYESLYSDCAASESQARTSCSVRRR